MQCISDDDADDDDGTLVVVSTEKHVASLSAFGDCVVMEESMDRCCIFCCCF